jgi:hypothetical protein
LANMAQYGGSMLRCGPVLGVCLLGFVAACGESKGDDGGGKGGSSNETGGATSSGGSGPGASGSSSGSSSGGMSGSSGSGVGGSSAGSSSNGPCGDLTRNGRCASNVYEWCDYFTGGVERLDCTPLGATCRALESQPWEDESNGCVTGPCGTDGSSCDGPLFSQCEDDGMVVNDCEKFGGPGSTCVSDGTSVRCTRQECSNPNDATCAGDLRLICDEEGFLSVQDCSRCDPAGTCVPTPGTDLPVGCDRFSWGCEQ